MDMAVLGLAISLLVPISMLGSCTMGGGQRVLLGIAVTIHLVCVGTILRKVHGRGT